MAVRVQENMVDVHLHRKSATIYSKNSKYGGSKIMVGRCLSYYGAVPTHKIDGVVNINIFVEIMDNVMLLHCREKMPIKRFYHHDNAHKSHNKHKSRRAKEWLRVHKIEVMEWPAHGNMWGDLKRANVHG